MNTQTVSPLLPEPSLLPGFNVLLEGGAGSGKTHCIGTLVDSAPQLGVFFISLESGMESLLGYWRDKGRDIPPNLHWHQFGQARQDGFGKMAETSSLIANATQSSLAKMQDFSRGANNPFERFLKVMNGFEDQRTGEKFGPVDSWGPDRCIVIDGLTGLGNFAMAMQVGVKPVRDKPDYGVVQDQLERLLRYTCDGCKCHFVLIAHIERETDDVRGSMIMTSAPGQKLSPKIPTMFSDVIWCERRGATWAWNTASALADLKTRNLPYSEKLEPNFKPIIDKWTARGGRFSPNVKS